MRKVTAGRALILTFTAVVSASTLSCGSDGAAPAACDKFTPCGGSVTGSWQAEQTCPPPPRPLLPDCDASKLDLTGVNALGDVTFTADMKYTRNLSFSGTAKITLPKTCLPAFARAADCPLLGQLLPIAQAQGMIDINVPGVLACTGTTVCDCTLTLDPAKAKDTSTGSFATTGNTMILTPTTGEPSSFDYCATGKQLVAKPTASAMASTDFSAVGLTFLKK